MSVSNEDQIKTICLSPSNRKELNH
jgi:hypothetical protein